MAVPFIYLKDTESDEDNFTNIPLDSPSAPSTSTLDRRGSARMLAINTNINIDKGYYMNFFFNASGILLPP